MWENKNAGNFHTDNRNRVCAGEGKVAEKQNNCKGKGRKKREPGQKQQFSPLRIYIFMFAYTYVKKNVFTFNSYLPPTE